MRSWWGVSAHACGWCAGGGLDAGRKGQTIRILDRPFTGGPPHPTPKPCREATHVRILKTEPFLPKHLSQQAKSFLEQALRKDPRERPAPETLLQHPWIQSPEGSTGRRSTRGSKDLATSPGHAAALLPPDHCRTIRGLEGKRMASAVSPRPDLIPAQHRQSSETTTMPQGPSASPGPPREGKGELASAAAVEVQPKG